MKGKQKASKRVFYSDRNKGKHKYSSDKHKSIWRLDKEALKYKYLHKGKLK